VDEPGEELIASARPRFAIHAWIDSGLLLEPPWTLRCLGRRGNGRASTWASAPHAQCRRAQYDTAKSYRERGCRRGSRSRHVSGSSMASTPASPDAHPATPPARECAASRARRAPAPNATQQTRAHPAASRISRMILPTRWPESLAPPSLGGCQRSLDDRGCRGWQHRFDDRIRARAPKTVQRVLRVSVPTYLLGREPAVRLVYLRLDGQRANGPQDPQHPESCDEQSDR
jgi:hypothetical protein